jgi:predicted  nucleic acid-binding Zn-ribbon protein
MASNDPINTNTQSAGSQFIHTSHGNEPYSKPVSKTRDSISTSQPHLNLQVPPSFSPLPQIPTDPKFDLLKTQNAITQSLETMPKGPNVSTYEALSSLNAFTGDLRQSALTTSDVLSKFSSQQAQLTLAQQQQAALSVDNISNLVNESAKLKQQIEQVTQAIKDAEKSKNASQASLNQLNDQIVNACSALEKGQTPEKSELNQLCSIAFDLSRKMQPPLTPPNDLASLVGWLNQVGHGGRSIGKDKIESLENLLQKTNNPNLIPFAKGLIENYHTSQTNISSLTIDIGNSQNDLKRLNAQILANESTQKQAINELSSVLNIPVPESIDEATYLAGQITRANQLASQIVGIVAKTNIKAQDMGIEALKAFVAISALINRSNQEHQIELAQQGQKTSRLNMDQAAFQLSLALQLADVSKQIAEYSKEIGDKQAKVKELSDAATGLGIALAVASVGAALSFGLASGTAIALGIALGAVLIAKGALNVEISKLETKVADEQQKQAELGRDLTNVKTANEQLSQCATTFTELLSSISKNITDATKNVSTAIGEFGNASLAIINNTRG